MSTQKGRPKFNCKYHDVIEPGENRVRLWKVNKNVRCKHVYVNTDDVNKKQCLYCDCVKMC